MNQTPLPNTHCWCGEGFTEGQAIVKPYPFEPGDRVMHADCFYALEAAHELTDEVSRHGNSILAMDLRYLEGMG